MTREQFDALPLPWQNPSEWFYFLTFVEGYLKGVEDPVAVELGTYENKQKAFFEAIGCRHIGIDADPLCMPDILGDSHDAKTLIRLRDRTDKIDVLFIDASHDYVSVVQDFQIYSPLVKGIIAFHDIFNWKYDVERFWKELVSSFPGLEKKTFLTINAKQGYANHGIGLVVD